MIGGSVVRRSGGVARRVGDAAHLGGGVELRRRVRSADRTNERTNEQTDERTNERTNDRTTERPNERARARAAERAQEAWARLRQHPMALRWVRAMFARRAVVIVVVVVVRRALACYCLPSARPRRRAQAAAHTRVDARGSGGEPPPPALTALLVRRRRTLFTAKPPWSWPLAYRAGQRARAPVRAVSLDQGPPRWAGPLQPSEKRLETTRGSRVVGAMEDTDRKGDITETCCGESPAPQPRHLVSLQAEELDARAVRRKRAVAAAAAAAAAAPTDDARGDALVRPTSLCAAHAASSRASFVSISPPSRARRSLAWSSLSRTHARSRRAVAVATAEAAGGGDDARDGVRDKARARPT